MSDSINYPALSQLAGIYSLPAKLTEPQKTKLAAALYSKLGNRSCEMCSSPTWAIGDNIVSPDPLSMSHITKSYSRDFLSQYPSAHLVCTNCGNTKLFLLSVLGYDPFASAT